MFYHFLVSEIGHPTREENFIEKKYQNARSFSFNYTSKLNQQKQRYAVSKSAANIYLSSKYD